MSNQFQYSTDVFLKIPRLKGILVSTSCNRWLFLVICYERLSRLIKQFKPLRKKNLKKETFQTSTGFEPVISAMSVRQTNQLSYEAITGRTGTFLVGTSMSLLELIHFFCGTFLPAASIHTNANRLNVWFFA